MNFCCTGKLKIQIDVGTLSCPQAGNYVKDDVWHALIVLMSNASELQGYSVRSLYKALQASGEQVWRKN